MATVGDVDVVWQCSKCKSIRPHDIWAHETHQICHIHPYHNKTVELKVKCRKNCEEIVPFGTEICPKCNKPFGTSTNMDSYMCHEQRIQQNAFLRACVNFNTDYKNAMLLFYGFIHYQNRNKSMQKRFPFDIAKFCICLLWNLHTKFTPYWDFKCPWDKEHSFWNEYVTIDTKNKQVSYEPDMGYANPDYARFVWLCDPEIKSEPKCIRKVWKIKVNKANDCEFSFRIGFDIPNLNCQSITNSNSLAETTVVVKNERMYAQKTMKHITNVNDNDIICLLIINQDYPVIEHYYDNNYWNEKKAVWMVRSTVWIGVNDFIYYTCRNIKCTERDWNAHRLRVVMWNPTKLTIVE
eukprot:219515_1